MHEKVCSFVPPFSIYKCYQSKPLPISIAPCTKPLTTSTAILFHDIVKLLESFIVDIADYILYCLVLAS